jgi:polar amino acid transport system substrate-binding protein
MIGVNQEDQDVSGIDVDIVREISKRMNLELELVRCSWARCLHLMRSGDVDLLSSVWKRPEREEYLRYFDSPFLDHLPITFYVKKGSPLTIDTYEDLYHIKSIGVLRKASYFERFDLDDTLKKQEVSSQDQLFPMLLADRIEAIAGYVPTVNYRLVTEGYRGQIERTRYEFAEKVPVYMAMSKQSRLINRFDEFNQVNTALADEGILTLIRDKYYRQYTP